MAAPEFNQFWRLRSKHGRDKIFETPKILAEACLEYIEVFSEMTIPEQQWVGKDAIAVIKHHPVPLTLSGLLVFLDISNQTWYDYKKRDDFIDICTRIENIFFTQKFNYAATGFFNANIIARDLGLKDRSDITTKDKELPSTENFFFTSDDFTEED